MIFTERWVELGRTKHVEGRGVFSALSVVRNDDENDVVEPMIARSIMVGDESGVEEGGMFIYRAGLYLVGLHDDLVRGISLELGRIVDGVEVAACLVVVFPLHNFFLHDDVDDDLVIYGGEGGELVEAHRHHVRVLHDQQWSRRNLTLRNSIVQHTSLCLVAAELMEADWSYARV
ncbi:hypothetical protein TSUD_44750 [Trifolium subterraneum]|nr:hypothetical protein TSUD_44750 [Trifolium subterraneum]